jgi:hypothetical protein
MKKVTFATIAASALAAVTIGLAAPAVAAPSGPYVPGDTHSRVEGKNQPQGGKTPYGTYQNDNKRESDRNR